MNQQSLSAQISKHHIITFSFTDPGQSLLRRCHQLFCQIGHVDIFLEKQHSFRSQSNYRYTHTAYRSVINEDVNENVREKGVEKLIRLGTVVDLHSCPHGFPKVSFSSCHTIGLWLSHYRSPCNSLGEETPSWDTSHAQTQTQTISAFKRLL